MSIAAKRSEVTQSSIGSFRQQRSNSITSSLNRIASDSRFISSMQKSSSTNSRASSIQTSIGKTNASKGTISINNKPTSRAVSTPKGKGDVSTVSGRVSQRGYSSVNKLPGSTKPSIIASKPSSTKSTKSSVSPGSKHSTSPSSKPSTSPRTSTKISPEFKGIESSGSSGRSGSSNNSMSYHKYTNKKKTPHMDTKKDSSTKVKREQGILKLTDYLKTI